MFTANACYNAKYLGEKQYEHYPEQPMSFDAYLWAKDHPGVDLAEIAAKFPKFVKVKYATNSMWINIRFSANGVNKGDNETGLKRLRKFLELAGELEWKAPSLNSYKTLADFLAAL